MLSPEVPVTHRGRSTTASTRAKATPGHASNFLRACPSGTNNPSIPENELHLFPSEGQSDGDGHHYHRQQPLPDRIEAISPDLVTPIRPGMGHAGRLSPLLFQPCSRGGDSVHRPEITPLTHRKNMSRFRYYWVLELLCLRLHGPHPNTALGQQANRQKRNKRQRFHTVTLSSRGETR